MSNIIDDLIACLRNHYADSRVLGNVRAGDALAAISALDRKARAFDLIEHAWTENRFDIVLGSDNADGYVEVDGNNPDLLTAIEAATALEAKETKDAH